MPKLKKLFIETTHDGVYNRHELKIAWDNDWRQVVVLKSLTPDNVKQCLIDAARLIAQEQNNGCL